MERVAKWFQELKFFQHTSEDLSCVRAVFLSFYPGRRIAEVSLGSK